jgi:hypothetical protein
MTEVRRYKHDSKSKLTAAHTFQTMLYLDNSMFLSAIAASTYECIYP